jgi:hypothetical protein
VDRALFNQAAAGTQQDRAQALARHAPPTARKALALHSLAARGTPRTVLVVVTPALVLETRARAPAKAGARGIQQDRAQALALHAPPTATAAAAPAKPGAAGTLLGHARAHARHVRVTTFKETARDKQAAAGTPRIVLALPLLVILT